MKLHRFASLAMLLVLPASAGAADLGPYAGACFAPVYASVPVESSLPMGAPDHASMEILWNDLHRRYFHAIELSQQRQAVIFNPSQLYTWAEATKLSCGKAIGYLNSHEVNVLQVNECDCFHRRMVALAR